jgi:ATP-dependent DNA helicase RecG
MPPREPSVTRSSKSATNKPAKPGEFGLDTPIQFLKGVGPRVAALLKTHEIETLGDLVTTFPRAYELRTQTESVQEVVEGSKISVDVEVLRQREIPMRQRFLKRLEVTARDADGIRIDLVWFKTYPGLKDKFETGKKFKVTGTLKTFQGIRQITHPEFQPITQLSAPSRPESDAPSFPQAAPTAPTKAAEILPLYSEIEGVPAPFFRRILKSGLEAVSNYIQEDLPREMLEKHGLPGLRESLWKIHFPDPIETQSKVIEQREFSEFRSPAHLRMIYEEFFKFSWLVLTQKESVRKEKGFPIDASFLASTYEIGKSQLPFTLTGAQDRTLKEIFADMAQPFPMNRLVQGDVGSGKTAVALLAALPVLKAGHQVALMAPTEILAEQHFHSIKKLLPQSSEKDFEYFLWTGKTTEKERREIAAHLQSGKPTLVVGTHALIEEGVSFTSLGLAMIDEQHRFGVQQRKKLREKNASKLIPHILILTATPIPRTLSLTVYGDLEVSLLDELPPGRKPIKTRLLEESGRLKLYEYLRTEIGTHGKQAYFIFPLVEDSEKEEMASLRSATEQAEYLANEIFPEFKIGLLHGRMKGQEKTDVLERFFKRELHILVSTTVIEVGIDNPNAFAMIIENSERFGLSQLHQLRGRVGRGPHESWCFLFTILPAQHPSRERLQVFARTQNGFEIAEADLELRGPGEFLGTRQSGKLPFRLADLVRDKEWLLKAREDVSLLLARDRELTGSGQENFRRFLENKGQEQSEILRTS